jgi:hypothetical protein
VATAMLVAITATSSEFIAASPMPPVVNSLTYHLVEKPPQIMASLLTLKE